MRNESGFSLIEVMTATAIMLVAIAAFMTFTDNSYKALSRQTSKASQLFMVQDLRNEISNDDLCTNGITATMQSFNPVNGRMSLLFKLSNGTELIKGKVPAGYDFVFDGLDFVPSGPGTPIAMGGKRHYGDLQLNASTVKGGGKMAFAPAGAGKIYLWVNAMGMIYKCSSTSAGPSDAGMSCTDAPWFGSQACKVGGGAGMGGGPWVPPYAEGQICLKREDISLAKGGNVTLLCRSVCKRGIWQSAGCTLGAS